MDKQLRLYAINIQSPVVPDDAIPAEG